MRRCPCASVQLPRDGHDRFYVIVDGARVGEEGNYTLTLTPEVCPNAPPPIECRNGIDADCAEGEACIEGMCFLIEPDAACEDDLIVALPGPGTYQGNTVGAPFGMGGADCVEAGPLIETDRQGEVAHHIRFNQNTPVCVSTRGSSMDTVVYVKRGNCSADAQELGCSDDTGFSTYSQLQFQGAANVDYFIIVDGLNGAQMGEGDYVLTVFEGA